jgi:hypothetical protein
MYEPLEKLFGKAAQKRKARSSVGNPGVGTGIP